MGTDSNYSTKRIGLAHAEQCMEAGMWHLVRPTLGRTPQQPSKQFSPIYSLAMCFRPVIIGGHVMPRRTAPCSRRVINGTWRGLWPRTRAATGRWRSPSEAAKPPCARAAARHRGVSASQQSVGPLLQEYTQNTRGPCVVLRRCVSG